MTEAALAYVGAVRLVHEEAGSRDWLHAIIARDWLLHELVASLGLECFLCDPGTCPSQRLGRNVPMYEGRAVIDVELPE